MSEPSVEIRSMRGGDKNSIVELWNLVFPDHTPHNDPAADVERKLSKDPQLFLVAVNPADDAVIGTAMAGFDGHRAAVWRVAVHPDWRGKRIGSDLMAAVEAAVKAEGGHKLNLLIREGNTEVIKFYEHLGYSVEPRTAMGKLL